MARSESRRSANFDRAAAFYDETRRLPDPAMQAFLEGLEYALEGTRDVLELGVGTGRIAIPLSARGLSMTGVDVSSDMLSVLAAKDPTVATHRVDATELPFEEARFDAVLAVDFFHLVPDWRRVVDESIRVLKPSGRLVVSGFEVVRDPTLALRRQIFAKAGREDRRVGVDLEQLVSDLANRHDATAETLPSVHYMEHTTLALELKSLRDGVWSRYWEMSPALRSRTADLIEAELRAQDSDLQMAVERRIKLNLYRVSLPPNGR